VSNAFNILATQIVLFISVCKWCVLGTLVGVAVGLAVAVFLKAPNYSIALTGQFPYYFLLFPLALLVKSGECHGSRPEGHQ
jgi:hypothetical protein